ncbi:hypothetical protein CCACVL1_01154, partial [Corchorus capsularis]
ICYITSKKRPTVRPHDEVGGKTAGSLIIKGGHFDQLGPTTKL